MLEAQLILVPITVSERIQIKFECHEPFCQLITFEVMKASIFYMELKCSEEIMSDFKSKSYC